MEKRILEIRKKMHQHQIRQYKIASYLEMPDYALSLMLNFRKEMSEEILQKIENYLEQFEKTAVV